MRQSEIVIGRTYRTNTGAKATIKEGPVKRDSYSQVKVFICDTERGERRIESKEFLRLWTEEDEQRMIKQHREREMMEALSNDLAFSGFAPQRVWRYGKEDDLCIEFQGLTAKRLAEHILGKEIDLEAYIIEEDEE